VVAGNDEQIVVAKLCENAADAFISHTKALGITGRVLIMSSQVGLLHVDGDQPTIDTFQCLVGGGQDICCGNVRRLFRALANDDVGNLPDQMDRPAGPAQQGRDLHVRSRAVRQVTHDVFLGIQT